MEHQSDLLLRDGCPLCNDSRKTPYVRCKDYTVSGESFQIVACGSCGFMYTDPVPSPAVIGKYYKSEDYISHSGTRKGIVAQVYHLVRNLTLRRKYRLISGLTRGRNLLDFGCGTGNFLQLCLDHGWKVSGIEPDSEARQRIAPGISVFREWKDLAESENRKYSVITLWHVLEHVYDLKETLGFFNSRLEKDGALVVAVPNYRSKDAGQYGEFWAAYDVPRHLYHFDRDTLTNLAEITGFIVESIEPMWFDSFYVSMLSEKYRGRGTMGLLSAIIAGLRSNISARNTGEYSSLIYIIRKA